MFCLGTRLDLFSFPSKLPKITPPGCFHRVELLRLHCIGKTIGSFLASLLVYLIGLSPSMFIEIYKKNPASLFIPSSMFVDFITFAPPHTFIWIWTLKLQFWMDSYLTFRTFPDAIDSKNRMQRLREQKVKCSNEFFHGLIHNWSAKILGQWPP